MSDIDSQIEEFELLEEEIIFWEKFHIQVREDEKKTYIARKLEMLREKRDKIKRSICREN